MSAIFNQKIYIRERCKGVHCVDLGESIQTHMYLQNLASIQPRTSPVKRHERPPPAALQGRRLGPERTVPRRGQPRRRRLLRAQDRRPHGIFKIYKIWRAFVFLQPQSSPQVRFNVGEIAGRVCQVFATFCPTSHFVKEYG